MAERKKEVVRGGLWDMCRRTNHRREYIYQRGLTQEMKKINKNKTKQKIKEDLINFGAVCTTTYLKCNAKM